MTVDFNAPRPELVYATGETPLFGPGDAVRVLERNPIGHYRVPIYLRGKKGVVEKVIEPTAVDNEAEGASPPHGELSPGDDSESPAEQRQKSRISGSTTMTLSVCAIALGAALGALLRWYLANRLNALFPQLPPGTLAANILGAYLIGIAMTVFLVYPAVSPEWKLLIVTGFLGGLTTFSTFSAEVVTALLQGRSLWALSTIFTHVVGSIVMTLCGVGTVQLIRRFS